MASRRPEKIDIHTHVIPPSWRKDCQTYCHVKPKGMTRDPPWKPEAHLKFMDDLNIRKTIVSISAPGTHLVWGDDILGQKITREANEYMSAFCLQNPDRLGFFAALPLPNVKMSLEEIDYALDKLGATGFGLMTNIHGVYPGDPQLDKVFQRLNERKAIVFIHPTNCHHVPLDGSTPQIVLPLADFPGGALEYIFDTTRTVTNLLISGTVTRNPNITFVVAHCGSTLPTTLERIANFATRIPNSAPTLSGEEMKQKLREQFYFDLAGLPFPDQLPAMTRLVGPENFLYGTDFPYFRAPLATKVTDIMDKGLNEMFDKEAIEKIYIGNATQLLHDR